MRRLTLVSKIVGTAILTTGLAVFAIPDRVKVIRAQTVPTTVHAEFVPSVVDATHPAPIQYSVSLDGGAPVIFPAASCSPTSCLVAITVGSFGPHTTSVVAQNLAISTDPNSIQSSAPATVNWRLEQVSNKSGDPQMKK